MVKEGKNHHGGGRTCLSATGHHRPLASNPGISHSLCPFYQPGGTMKALRGGGVSMSSVYCDFLSQLPRMCQLRCRADSLLTCPARAPISLSLSLCPDLPLTPGCIKCSISGEGNNNNNNNNLSLFRDSANKCS